jgi:hypothetical protein
MYLVLDEADRLLQRGFSTELEIILSKMSTRRKTLLFSATLTSSLEELEGLALNDALRFDLTKTQKVFLCFSFLICCFADLCCVRYVVCFKCLLFIFFFIGSRASVTAIFVHACTYQSMLFGRFVTKTHA